MSETIWLTAQNSAADLQARLDAQPEGASVDFAPRREYPGPVVLNRALVLEGSGATLWALAGPVLTVRAAVRLRNLCIEVTGDAPPSDDAACAISVASGGHLTLENVEVRGLVRGLPQEGGVWHYPHGLALHGIAPGVAHYWRLTLRVPVDCTIESHISGLKVTPSALRAGINDLQVHIDALPRDFLIDGYVLLSTAALRRRIAVTAYADESPGAPCGQGQVIWVPPAEVLPPTGAPAVPPEPTSPEPLAPTSPPLETGAGALPASNVPSPKPAPVQPPAKDRTSRLRRGQLPNGLFANSDGPGKRLDPEPAPTTGPETVLGSIFRSGDGPPPSQGGSSAHAGLQESAVEHGEGLAGDSADRAGQAANIGMPQIARKPTRGVPTQRLFGGGASASPALLETSNDPVAPVPQPSPPDDRDSTAKTRHRGASLPVNGGDLFKTLGS